MLLWGLYGNWIFFWRRKELKVKSEDLGWVNCGVGQLTTPRKASDASLLVKDDQGPRFYRCFYRTAFFGKVVYLICFGDMCERKSLMADWIVLDDETGIPSCSFEGGGIAVGQDPSPHGKPRRHLSRDRIIS